MTVFFFLRPNVCIEREEIDESSSKTATPTTTEAITKVDQQNDDDAVIFDDSDEEDGMTSRQSRQFSAHMRTSSCSDEGITYLCETK